MTPSAATPPPTSVAGMPKTPSARTTAMTMPASAATQTRALSTTSTKKSVTHRQGGDQRRQRPRAERVVVWLQGMDCRDWRDYIHPPADPSKKCLSSAESARLGRPLGIARMRRILTVS